MNNRANGVCDVLFVHVSRKLKRDFLSSNKVLGVTALLWKYLSLCKVVIYLTEAILASIH